MGTVCKPLIAVGGQTCEVSVGGVLLSGAEYASLTAHLAAGGGSGPTSGAFPFFKTNGTLDSIPVTNGELPFYTSDGTLDPIPVS